MKVVNKELLDMEGKPIVLGDVTMTVAKVLMNVALAPEPPKDPDKPPKNLSADDQRTWWEFAIKVNSVALNESFEVTAEQIVKIKDRLPYLYTTIITGQLAAILEGAH